MGKPCNLNVQATNIYWVNHTHRQKMQKRMFESLRADSYRQPNEQRQRLFQRALTNITRIKFAQTNLGWKPPYLNPHVKKVIPYFCALLK